jgi:hypothetical protein
VRVAPTTPAATTLPRSNDQFKDPAIVSMTMNSAAIPSPDSTDATAHPVEALSGLKINATDPAFLETTEDEGLTNLTPTQSSMLQDSGRGRGGTRVRRGKKGRNAKKSNDGNQRGQGNGWRQTPMLETTDAFQPFTMRMDGLRKM